MEDKNETITSEVLGGISEVLAQLWIDLVQDCLSKTEEYKKVENKDICYFCLATGRLKKYDSLAPTGRMGIVPVYPNFNEGLKAIEKYRVAIDYLYGKE